MSGSEDRGADARPGFFAVAVSAPVVRRAFGYLVVVGAVLVAINHGDAILRGDVDATRLAKIVITPLVPYVVSTLSSVAAIRGRPSVESPR